LNGTKGARSDYQDRQGGDWGKFGEEEESWEQEI